MQTLTRYVIQHGLSNQLFTEAQLARVLGGSDQRRYNLVNRAMKSGELLRLRRGQYLLADPLRDQPAHPFAAVQAYVPGAYVSFEAALSYHGWIPETVFTITCVTPGRKSKTYQHEKFGSFSFRPLPTRSGHFLELVRRVRSKQQSMLVAQPVRALIDLVCLRKIQWQGTDWLQKDLRIDDAQYQSVTAADIRTLKLVYRQKRVLAFLDQFAKELNID